VRVESRRHALRAEVGALEAFGALSLAGGPRRASVETLSRCRFLRLGRDGLRRLAAHDAPAAERLLESIAREAARRADAALAAHAERGVDPRSGED
jgi:CRP-like cAMP-binding protein